MAALNLGETCDNGFGTAVSGDKVPGVTDDWIQSMQATNHLIGKGHEDLTRLGWNQGEVSLLKIGERLAVLKNLGGS